MGEERVVGCFMCTNAHTDPELTSNDDLMCWGNINHVTMIFCAKENAVRAWNRRVPYGKN